MLKQALSICAISHRDECAGREIAAVRAVNHRRLVESRNAFRLEVVPVEISPEERHGRFASKPHAALYKQHSRVLVVLLEPRYAQKLVTPDQAAA